MTDFKPLIEAVKAKGAISRSIRGEALSIHGDGPVSEWRTRYLKAEQDLNLAYQALRDALQKVCPVAIIDPRWNP